MKRIKWLMLLCAFAVMWSSPGWADGEITTSQALKAAFENVTEAKTITLSGNITDLTQALVVSKDADITIDLNGHNITNTTTAVFINKGKLTIKGNGTVLASAGTKKRRLCCGCKYPRCLMLFTGRHL